MNIVWISKIEKNMLHKTSRIKLSEALIKRGHKITLYIAKRFGENSLNLDYCVSIPTIHIPILSGFFYGLIIFFYFPILLIRKKVDLIIIDGTKIWLPFIIPLKILNIPLVLDIRTLPIDKEKSFFFNINMSLSRYIVNGIMTITQELEHNLKKMYNLNNIKFGIWSSGVSVDDFQNVGIHNNEYKEKKFILIYHGDYSPTRGIENLIYAISYLDSPIKNKIKLMIIGIPKNQIIKLLKIAENIGVKEQIDILPQVDYKNIAYYIGISNVGIIPLPTENKWWQVSAPLKTLEYLAACKPIIATKIPFHLKIFEKGNCGVLLENGLPETIAKAIIDLYNKQNDLIKMGRIGRNIVERFFAWDIIAIKVEDFLKMMLN